MGLYILNLLYANISKEKSLCFLIENSSKVGGKHAILIWKMSGTYSLIN